MGLYDNLKDIALVLQKADNVDLYKQLIELSSQALDIQNQLVRLSQENQELKQIRNIELDIERHELLYITRISEEHKYKYCTHCWDSERKIIQIDCGNMGKFRCPHCNTNGICDKDKNEAQLERDKQSMDDYIKYNNQPSW